MSLFVHAAKRAPKGTVAMGEVDGGVVAYDPKAPKDARTKMLTFPGQLVKPMPYLDLAHKQRSATFVSGVSGSGKSMIGASLIRKLRWLRKDAERPAAIFSTTLINDPAYANLKHVEFISLEDPRFLELEINELEDRIILFDDHENLKDPRLARYALGFIKDVLERTRKLGVDVVVINHMTQNYHATRNIIFECDTYYLNIAQNRNSSKRFLTSYTELSKKEISDLCSQEYESAFVFVTYHKCAPCFVSYEDTIRLV
jgi:ABC-type dipeptide/oligopeptide/nickel transport system ATPase component